MPDRWEWVVRDGDAVALSGLMDRFGVEARSGLSDGRVFVNGRRVQDAERRLCVGDHVVVYRLRASGPRVTIVAERDAVIAVSKPPGVPTEPDRHGEATSVIHQVAALMGVKPGSLHAATRLDLGVSGVVLVACTAAARRALEQARAEGRLRRRYLALAPGAPVPLEGTWSAGLPARAPGGRARSAVTRYASAAVSAANGPSSRVEGSAFPAVLLVLEPTTGRTHQLRIHASRAGIPLLGDRAYGGARRLLRSDGSVLSIPRVALHAARVRWDQPAGPWFLQPDLPPDLISLWQELGGREDDLSEALGREDL